jgi:TldD protein
VIEEAVLERTLHTALRDGGDFAEVFAEDRRVATARLDESKIEELVSGRERGAGIRVVRGDTTGYAHTADLSEHGLSEAASAAAAAARGTPGQAHVVALERRAVEPTHDVEILPPAPSTTRSARSASATPMPAAASSWPILTAYSSRTTPCAPGSW